MIEFDIKDWLMTDGYVSELGNETIYKSINIWFPVSCFPGLDI